jgi:hypothetical protein
MIIDLQVVELKLLGENDRKKPIFPLFSTHGPKNEPNSPSQDLSKKAKPTHPLPGWAAPLAGPC